MKKILTSLLSLSLLSAPVMAKDILDKLTVADGFTIACLLMTLKMRVRLPCQKEALCMLVHEKRAMYMH